MSDKITIDRATVQQAIDAFAFAYNESDSDWVRDEKIIPADTALRAALAAPQPAAQPAEPVSYEAALDEYLDDYEMRGETPDGLDACYQPTESEKALIKDAIMGFDWPAAQPAPSVDWQNIGALMEAHSKAKAAGLTGGTTSWGAFIAREMLKAAPQTTERNFCERCGKRSFDGIHTCTPPKEAK